MKYIPWQDTLSPSLRFSDIVAVLYNDNTWYIMIKNEEGKNISKEIERSVVQLLAYIFPLEQVRRLPDGTGVSELVIDVSRFVFRDLKEGSDIRILTSSSLPFSLF